MENSRLDLLIIIFFILYFNYHTKPVGQICKFVNLQILPTVSAERVNQSSRLFRKVTTVKVSRFHFAKQSSSVKTITCPYKMLLLKSSSKHLKLTTLTKGRCKIQNKYIKKMFFMAGNLNKKKTFTTIFIFINFQLPQ